MLDEHKICWLKLAALVFYDPRVSRHLSFFVFVLRFVGVRLESEVFGLLPAFLVDNVYFVLSRC